MLSSKYFEIFYQKVLSDKVQKQSERIILVIAIASFILHLAIIYIVNSGIVILDKPSELLRNPIAAIYTPFSFILVYEVYLLIFFLPKSITTYIGKQYEIISLIIIRRLFKDLSTLSFSADWFKIKYDLQFTYDLLASVLLFYLIYQFYLQRKKSSKNDEKKEQDESKIERMHGFIKIKKLLSASLVPVIIFVAFYSFISWLLGVTGISPTSGISFKNINNIFFEQFFTILIVVDVILLLFSFFHTDQFHKVIRNSGFIISTILIRLSFSVTGLLNTLLIVTAIIFGLLILIIHNKFEENIATED